MLAKGSELKVKTTFSGLIFGVPGTGKTTMGLSAPRPLLIDCDNGVERTEYRHRKDVAVCKPQSFNEIADVVNKHSGECDTFVIDTIGSLVDFMLEQVMTDDPKMRQRDGSPTLKAYGAVIPMFKALITSIRTKGKSILFIGHADEKTEDDITKYRVQCAGKTANVLITMLDFVGFYDMMGNKRVITFTPSERAYAKNSLGLVPVIEVPDVASHNNDFITKVIAEAMEKRANEANSDTQQLFDALLTEMQDRVNECTTPEMLTDAWNWGKGLKHIWESAERFSIMLKNKAKELKFAFDTNTKKFIKEA
jgi:phage nucleotide-binding protein